MEKSDVDKLLKIFFSHSHQRQMAVKETNARFVHYTSAEAAAGILRNGQIWMRESSCMNDFREVEHGIDCLTHAYRSENTGKDFQSALNEIYPDVANEIAVHFDKNLPNIKTETYLTCFSEHKDEEDKYGRLSMWRAYCGSAGVALVLKNNAFFDGPGLLKAYTSPVAYLTDTQLEQELGYIAQNIRANAQFIRSQGKDVFKNIVFQMLRFASVSTKHPAFKEELEWRVIHCPTMEPSEHLIKSVETINGLPQTVYKIPLASLPDLGITGGSIPEIIDRIIIGPTQYPLALYKAFVALLRDAKVERPETKVHFSDVPLRSRVF